MNGGWPEGGDRRKSGPAEGFGPDAFQRLFTAWEKSAAAFADGAVRNPKVLELGAGLMRAHLAWVRAAQVSVEAWAPLFGLGKEE